MEKLKKFLKSKIVVVDMETTSESGKKKDNVDVQNNQIICMALYDGVNKLALSAQEMDENRDTIKELLESETVGKIAFNAKFDLKTLYWKGFGRANYIYFDPQVGAKVLNSTGASNLASFSLVKLYEKYVGAADWKFDYDEEHSVEEWKELCLEDVIRTYELSEKMYSMLTYENLLSVSELKTSTLETTFRMEVRGIPADKEIADKLADRYLMNKDRIKRLLYKILEREGVEELHFEKENKKGDFITKRYELEEINFNSNDQLKALLYDKLKYPAQKKYDSKTRKQKLTTDKDSIAKLSSEGYTFARWLLFYRYWVKLAEYAVKIRDAIQDDGRIYSEYNPFGTETGRWSSARPNFQQIPSKTRESIAIRKIVTGDLVVADYSNMELRILAALSKDKGMLDVYKKSDGDIHQDLVDSLKRDLNLDVERKQAKSINFGVSYGTGGKGLATQLNIRSDKPWKAVKDRVTADYAQTLIDAWYKIRTDVKDWQDGVKRQTEACGYSSSLFGRRRPIDYTGLDRGNKRDEFKIAALDRQAINHVIQATAGEIIDLAIYALRDENIILMVHDEIVIENPKRPVAEIQEIMETVVDIGVDMLVDIKEVSCWADGK